MHALCNVQALLTNGLLRMGELADEPEEAFTSSCVFVCPSCSILTCRRERREHLVFQSLLQMVPGLEARLMEGTEDDVLHIGELVSRRDVLSLLSVDGL